MNRLLLVILLIVFIVLTTGFANMNEGQIVSIKFLGLRINGEFWIFSLCSMLFGFILGWVVCFLRSLKYRLRSRQLDRKLTTAEKKLQLGDVKNS